MSIEEDRKVISGNPYLELVRQNLPRILALFDTDRTSHSHGMGDRYYWAWGLIDFGNGTFQGTAHGLARLWSAGLWPFATPAPQFFARIDSMFAATSLLTRRDGSLEEAFPNEGSYCVTALVAFDLLCALDLLRAELDDRTAQRWQAAVAPLVCYLVKADETHAFISNHLATAVAALNRWHRLTGDAVAERRARELLDRILSHQSEEGWFQEYEGADPGYQTLCTYYLADVHHLRPDWLLLEPLRASFRFLWHCAHPDGSFGGLYGSRCTRFYYPAGVEALAAEIPEAAALADFMAESIGSGTVVTLAAIDEPNLIPTFNAYCWAAVLAAETRRSPAGATQLTLPALDPAPLRREYPAAGLLIDRGIRHYTVIGTRKGGVVYHFVAGRSVVCDGGVVVADPGGRLGSSQAYAEATTVDTFDGQVEIRAALVPMPKRLPSPAQFLVLRLLCLTLFSIPSLRERVKQLLVRLLISTPRPWPAWNLRRVTLGEGLQVTDTPQLPAGYRQFSSDGLFVPIHMASQGYWQRQDDEVHQ
jgi:hypothetical protein